MGRALSILLICTCISLGAVHFKRLKEAISRNVIDMGSRFDLSGYKYVLFWGVLSTRLTEYSTPSLVYRAVKRNTGINLCIFGGSEKICAPSSVYKFIGLSMLTVVVNNMETETHGDHNVDDQMTILRSIACLNITRHLGIPVGVQLHGSDYASFLNASDITRICYLRELKYKLIAKSVTCRGLFYLILTLFHTPTNMKRTRAYVEDLYNLFATSSLVPKYYISLVTDEEDEEPPKHNAGHSLQEVTKQLFEIITGMKFQLYKLEFPLCTHGLKFLELCQYLYKVKNIFLLGIVANNRCVLNPVEYIIGQQDEVIWHGLVLAKSLRDVLHVSMIKNPILDLLPIKVSETISAPQLGNFSAIPELTEVPMDERQRTEASMFNGIFKVDNWEQATQFFTEPRANLILVCGWLHDMHHFLKYLLADGTSNVICLAPLDVATSDCPMSLASFRNFVAYIDGSAMDANSLLIAGVAKATCIVVLNSEQLCTGRRNKQLSKDSQVLFVGHLIKKILASPSEGFKPPHIILDIQHSSCLEYLDPSLVSTMEASCGRDAMNRLWQNFGEFMTSYEMASGTIFVQDMLYGLLAHSYIPSFNSVGYDTIQQILDGDKDSKVSNGICLDELPLDLSGATFENLFKRKLFLEQKICVGILRTYTNPMVNGEQKQLIIVAPQPAFILHNDDQGQAIKPMWRKANTAAGILQNNDAEQLFNNWTAIFHVTAGKNRGTESLVRWEHSQQNAE
ncbi:ion transport protein [Babesia ovata]|uniref:Ion transport protein n=1 Tax=Babesia ovata TaxID=189622 RepID=A0A2H6KEN5_9APIC|nr:ion transport protein [Babesia ovata]GBE61447.1 ion transport protein [Babesia ovata]